MLKSRNPFSSTPRTSYPPSPTLPPAQGHPHRAPPLHGRSGTAPPGRRGPRGAGTHGRR